MTVVEPIIVPRPQGEVAPQLRYVSRAEQHDQPCACRAAHTTERRTGLMRQGRHSSHCFMSANDRAWHLARASRARRIHAD